MIFLLNFPFTQIKVFLGLGLNVGVTNGVGEVDAEGDEVGVKVDVGDLVCIGTTSGFDQISSRKTFFPSKVQFVVVVAPESFAGHCKGAPLTRTC